MRNVASGKRVPVSAATRRPLFSRPNNPHHKTTSLTYTDASETSHQQHKNVDFVSKQPRLILVGLFWRSYSYRTTDLTEAMLKNISFFFILKDWEQIRRDFWHSPVCSSWNRWDERWSRSCWSMCRAKPWTVTPLRHSTGPHSMPAAPHHPPLDAAWWESGSVNSPLILHHKEQEKKTTNTKRLYNVISSFWQPLSAFEY